MSQEIHLKKKGDKIVASFNGFPRDIIDRQDLIISSILMLIQILKKECVDTNVDTEEFNLRILSAIQLGLEYKKKLIHTL